MRDMIWRAIARFVTRPAVTSWLIWQACKTPYTDITGPDGTLYMGRWWLFNSYPASGEKKAWWGRWLPSVRIHHIMRADSDRHLHDHPWNARTIVLDGYYVEERPEQGGRDWRSVHRRSRGYTGRLLFGEYHRIARVSDKGVWTLFITWRYRGTWGFDVDGVKVPWRKYLGLES